jgi:hypothetical protein
MALLRAATGALAPRTTRPTPPLQARGSAVLYRIFTERKRTARIKAAAARLFPAFTLLPAHGCWQGQPERSLILEIETDDESKVLALAQHIKALNRQQAVLVQCLPISSRLV